MFQEDSLSLMLWESHDQHGAQKPSTQSQIAKPCLCLEGVGW